MIKSCETLFEPVRAGVLSLEGSRVLFLNAQICDDLKPDFTLWQVFKPFAQDIEVRGFVVQTEINAVQEFDVILHLFPKNILEGRYQIAQGLAVLRKGGVFICSGDNNAGGTRIKKILEEFGICGLQDIAKNKARVVWGRAEIIDESVLQKALSEGAVQEILDSSFVSQPGVFGWNKIDQGSALLSEYLPETLHGNGADFGCGYGFLARAALEKSWDIQNLICIDADARAIVLCQKNLQDYVAKTLFLWADLTTPRPDLAALDFIIMNPPFHEGKITDSSIGARFIQTAYQSLKRGGILWMVANTHLPYEIVLQNSFSEHQIIAQKNGFKVLKAMK